MIQLDLSILNQKGTPMFNSDIFANRPAFGIVGRIFISTDTSQIFRDTGTSYVLISNTSSGGTITGSGTTGTLPLWSGSTSLGDSLILQSGTSLFAFAKTFVLNTNTAISLLNPAALTISTINTFNGGITWPSLEPCDNVEFLQTNSYNGNITFQNSNYTANHLIVSSFNFLVASTTLTSLQATIGIRALSNQILQARINGTNNGTITHFANSLVYGDFAASTARFIFTNRYGYLVNNLDEYGAGHTYTNRYAFYNQGANDHNYFAGKMLLNTLVVTSDQLSVVGTTNFNGALTGTSALFASLNVTAANGISCNVSNNATSFTTLQVTNNGSGDLGTFFNSSGLKFRISNGGNGLFTGEVNSVGLKSTTSAAGNLNSFILNNVTSASAVTGYGLLIVSEASAATSYALSVSNISGSQTYLIISTETGRVGNVGINITTPSHTLDVSGTGRFSNTLYIGTSSVNSSAQLQADSTTKGFLPPRMTTSQKNAIASPAAGLIIYDSTLNKLCVRAAAAWETITSV